MSVYVIQSRNRVISMIGVKRLGGTITHQFLNLSALSGSGIFAADVSDRITPAAIAGVTGVTIVEGRFYHPYFHGIHPFKGIVLPKIPAPNQVAAAATQLLPPRLFKRLPKTATMNKVLMLNIDSPEALSQFSPRTNPFGAPGLKLGSVATGEQFAKAGDLNTILDTVCALKGQKRNQGEGAVVAVIDSGIAGVPRENMYGGFSDDAGVDPWQDSLGHGSMVARILLAAAPKIKLVSCRPAVNADGAMSSIGTLACLDYLAGLAQEIGQPIISNHSWGIYGVKNILIPCLTGDTFISTPKGPVEIQDLKPGDEVWSTVGKGLTRGLTKVGLGSRGYERSWRRWELDMTPTIKKVKAVVPQGVKQVYRLSTKYRQVKATGEHPFLQLKKVKTGRFSLEWTPASKLQAGDIILALKSLPENGMAATLPPNPWGLKLSTPELAKFSGYLVGDGSLQSGHQVVLCEPPGQRRDMYRKITVALFGERKERGGKRETIRTTPYHAERDNQLILYSGAVADFARTLVGTEKTLEKKIPRWVFSAPLEQRIAFVNGYMDADGHRRKNRAEWQFDSPNNQLIRQLRQLLLEAGSQVTKLKTLERPNVWRPDLTSLSHRFTHCPPGAGKRAKRTGLNGIRSGLRANPYIGFERVEAIEQILDQPVWDVQVEGETGVIFAEGLVTHNCNVFITRTVRLLNAKRLVMTSWAAGNNRHLAGDHAISGSCMNTTPWSTSCGALDRNLHPQFYSSLGGQCFPLFPTVSAPTYGILPWGSGYMDFGDQGGGTSACAPLVSGALALMFTEHPGKDFAVYRAALRKSAKSLGLTGLVWPAVTGSGLLQVDDAIQAVPVAKLHPSYLLEKTLPTSIPVLGQEP